MHKFRVPSYQMYGVLYLLILAIIFTILLSGKVTHQGMVLGLVSIVMGLLLIYRSIRSSQMTLLINAALFIVLEVMACIVVGVGSDPTELWFASFYSLFSLFLLLDILVQRIRSLGFKS
ncbi:hypothetical protein [Alicyclobacillus fodiniaquatilis]|uniref:Uncharacterized protein n=1 Tax=Alicyclobacillus fodiniaquatilis TaxID=1661150 RepID=A0ABW4JQN7_9BACL